MLVTSGRAIEAERFATETARAHAVAGYLSVVVPWGVAGYPPARLLSTASAIRSSGFWVGRLQVASGETSLLFDTLALFPLNEPVNVAVSSQALRLERPGTGPIAVVPLLDPGGHHRAGWVAAWGSLPSRQWPSLVLALSCLTLAGAVLTRRMAIPGARSTRLSWLALAALGPGFLLATVLGLSVRTTARDATDVILLTARRLAEIASSPEADRVPFDRFGPGLRWSVRRGVSSRDGEAHRQVTRGESEAAVVAILAGGRIVEITTVPRESLLTPVGMVLAGWVALLGAGLAIGACATPKPGR